MKSITPYNTKGDVFIDRIDGDGKIKGEWHKVYYYDSDVDVWCMCYPEEEHDHYYMKSDGRVIIDHAEARRFITGYTCIYRTREEDWRQIGSRTYFSTYIYDNNGRQITDKGYFQARRVDVRYGEAAATFKVICFPDEREAERMKFGFSPMCQMYQINVNLSTGSVLVYDIGQCKFNEAEGIADNWR